MLLLPGHQVCAVADCTGAYGAAADQLLGGIARHIEHRGAPRSIEDLEAAVRSGEAAVISPEPCSFGGGSTLDIAAFCEDRMVAIHVGDGRIYRVRRGVAEQLTTDHTWVQNEVAAGRLDPAGAAAHPLRNVIMRSFIGGEPLTLDSLTVEVEPDDRFILCTDGVWKSLSLDAILAAAGDDEALKRALARPCDNATIVVAQEMAR